MATSILERKTLCGSVIIMAKNTYIMVVIAFYYWQNLIYTFHENGNRNKIGLIAKLMDFFCSLNIRVWDYISDDVPF